MNSQLTVSTRIATRSSWRLNTEVSHCTSECREAHSLDQTQPFTQHHRHCLRLARIQVKVGITLHRQWQRRSMPLRPALNHLVATEDATGRLSCLKQRHGYSINVCGFQVRDSWDDGVDSGVHGRRRGVVGCKLFLECSEELVAQRCTAEDRLPSIMPCLRRYTGSL